MKNNTLTPLQNYLQQHGNLGFQNNYKNAPSSPTAHDDFLETVSEFKREMSQERIEHRSQMERDDGKTIFGKTVRRRNIFTESSDLFEAQKHWTEVTPKSNGLRNKLVDNLSTCFLFETLSTQDKYHVVDVMKKRLVTAGEVIFRQGDMGDYFYVVESGNLSALKAATVIANADSVLWKLDRVTFKHAAAQASQSTVETTLKALKAVPLLQVLTDEQLRDIAQVTRICEFSAGTKIIQKGDVGTTFYVIKSGKVNVINGKYGSPSKDGEVNTVLGPDNFFGEVALMYDAPRAADIVAATDVELIGLEKHAFISILGPIQEVIDDNVKAFAVQGLNILKDLTPEQKIDAFKLFSRERFRAGEYIIRQGEEATKFYVLREGEVEVLKAMTIQQIKTLKVGDFFGEMGLLSNCRRVANIRCLVDCECFVLTKEDFNALVQQESVRAKLEDGALERERGREFNSICTLGTGTFGRVKMIIHEQTKQTFALKIQSKHQVMKYNLRKNIFNEKNMLMQINHPFICKCYQTFQDKDYLYLLLELVQGGELFSLLQNLGPGLQTHHHVFYVACVVSALEVLHVRNIIYRDLKPENLMIDPNGYLKLVDFGFAKVVEYRTYTLCGTPDYFSPELVLGSGYGKGNDLWALGILAYELIAGFTPFGSNEDPQSEVYKKIVREEVRFPKDCYDQAGMSLISGLLQKRVENRVGCGRSGIMSVKYHPWFRDLNWDALLQMKLRAPWRPRLKNQIDASNFDRYDENYRIIPFKYDQHTNDPFKGF
eukprot:maker-scaffold_31-snap-gene-0.46-mRNA-1 protein AED:0.36 eAED:0.36 QI:0/0/0/1/0/0/4/0/770